MTATVPDAAPPSRGLCWTTAGAVVTAAVVWALSINISGWTLYAATVALDVDPVGAGGSAVPAVGALVVGLGISALAVLVAGTVFLTWLYRARRAAESLSDGRHRLASGWAIGAWFVPVANHVLPLVVVEDVWQASVPGPRTRSYLVPTWWMVTVVAGLMHQAAWIMLPLYGTTAEVTRTFVELHSVGSVGMLISACLLAAIVVWVGAGQRELASRPDTSTGSRPAARSEPRPAARSEPRPAARSEPRPAARSEPSGVGPAARPSAPPVDPLIPDDGLGAVGRILSVARRGGLPLALIETVPAALSSTHLVHDIATDGPTDWLVWVPSILVIVVVFLVFRAASMTVLLRQATGRPVSAVDALREVLPRAPRLIGWALLYGVTGVLLAALPLVTSFAVILLVFPVLLGLSMLVNIVLVGVVLVEGGGLHRSVDLLRGRFWPTAGRFLLVFPVLAVFSVVSSVVYVLAGQPIVALIVLTVISVPFYMFLSALVTVVYAELRWHESGRRLRTADLVEQMTDPRHLPPDLDLDPPAPVVPPAPAAPADPAVSDPLAITPVAEVEQTFDPADTRDPAGTDDEADGDAAAPDGEDDPPDPPAERHGEVRARPSATIVGGAVALVVISVAATLGATRLIDGGAEPPPPKPSAAAVLDALYAESRRSGSGGFRLQPGSIGIVESYGTFAYRGESVAVSAKQTEPDYSVVESAAVDGQNWVRLAGAGSDGPAGRWARCPQDTSEPMACRYPFTMQDLADPVQLLRRAGDATVLVDAGPQTIVDQRGTRYVMRLRAEKAELAERDPYWRERFEQTWLRYGDVVVLVVDPRNRLVQMEIGGEVGARDTIVYDWRAAAPIVNPAAAR